MNFADILIITIFDGVKGLKKHLFYIFVANLLLITYSLFYYLLFISILSQISNILHRKVKQSSYYLIQIQNGYYQSETIFKYTGI